jgi:hypothetical protein
MGRKRCDNPYCCSHEQWTSSTRREREREREIWNTSVPLIHPTLELDPIVLVANSSPI